MRFIPVLILLALPLIGLGMSCQSHGQPKTGKNDAWAYLISVVITMLLYWWAGLFNVFH